MELERKSSGVAKAGLTTGIIGTSLAALEALGSLGGVARNVSDGSCSEDHYVNRYELEQQQKIAKLESEIALRDANTYNDQKSLELYKYIDGKLKDIAAELSTQAVQNQKTADSFQMVSERMSSLKADLLGAIESEKHERRCADNTIVTYTNATFYPKQVADVTVGTTMTPQSIYNPLPAENCNCNC